jgi:DTW domain-containing protein YfiP
VSAPYLDYLERDLDEATCQQCGELESICVCEDTGDGDTD